MALRNDQYDLIMREYGRRQNENRRILEEHRRIAGSKVPAIARIDEEISSLSADSARKALLSGDRPDTASLLSRTSKLEERQRALLRASGFPEDYLEMTFTCPDCRDTGYTADGNQCRCFQSLLIDLLYQDKALAGILSKENFNTFSFDWYSDRIKDEATGRTPRENAEIAFQAAKDFVVHFDDSFRNLFFYGDTGVGKTFLCHCIADALLSSGRSVMMFSAPLLFEQLADRTFEKEVPGVDPDLLYDCDLVIIDDLGTELTNSFVSSQLFLCISERLARQKSTLISTNLSLKDFSETYSERTFSRIASTYRLLRLTGSDIRIQKKMNGGN